MLPTEQSFAFSTSSAAKAFKKSPSPSPLQAPDNRSKLTALTFDRWGERPREPLHCVCFGYFLRRSRIALRPPNRSCKLNLPRFNVSTLQRFNALTSFFGRRIRRILGCYVLLLLVPFARQIIVIRRHFIELLHNLVAFVGEFFHFVILRLHLLVLLLDILVRGIQRLLVNLDLLVLPLIFDISFVQIFVQPRNFQVVGLHRGSQLVFKAVQALDLLLIVPQSRFKIDNRLRLVMNRVVQLLNLLAQIRFSNPLESNQPAKRERKEDQ